MRHDKKSQKGEEITVCIRFNAPTHGSIFALGIPQNGIEIEMEIDVNTKISNGEREQIIIYMSMFLVRKYQRQHDKSGLLISIKGYSVLGGVVFLPHHHNEQCVSNIIDSHWLEASNCVSHTYYYDIHISNAI